MTQGTPLDALWRRAEEIRALCGLPAVGTHDLSVAALAELLLQDLEGNFRRELATRVQLEGLGELMAFASRGPEPDRPYRVLVQYLSRALDEPSLWLGVFRGSPPALTLYRARGASGAGPTPEPVALDALDPDWLRWLTVRDGEPTLERDPWGRGRSTVWHVVPIRGEIPADRLSGGFPACPGSWQGGPLCAVTDAPLEEMAGGGRECRRCEFRRVVGLMGVEGGDGWKGRASLEAIVPSLGALLVNLGLNEALDLEARFREDVIENLPLGVVAVDLEGVVLTWNRASEEILGITAATALGQRIGDIRGREPWHDSVLAPLGRLRALAPAEHVIPKSDGASVPVEVNAAPLRDAEGQIRGAVATLTDLTSLRAMEERIRQLDRLAALGRFASSVAHEIRNPLTGIATGVQYLSRGFPAGDERHEDVRFILREVTRLNTIVQDLLSATRPRMLTLGPVSLADVVHRALQTLGPALAEGTVEIRLEGADHWPKVLADTDQLLQVFLNLFQNAIQAIPGAGDVRVRVTPADASRVEIEIADSGVGIEPEHLPHLFEPFYTTRPKGTGLGLFVAHGIVQRHGGSIEVSSAPGEGTRFRILLPAAA